MVFRATFLTLYPEVFPGTLGTSILGRALFDGLWELETLDIRAFSRDRHRSVDDTPAGGGAGLVLRPDIAAAAIDAVPRMGRPLIYLTPRGKPITQTRVREIAAGPGAIVFCGRFEGLDERVITSRGMEEIAVGDVVLAGGEVAGLLMIEACVRLLPGVLGNQASLTEESFETGLLEAPQYTRPRVFEGQSIPDVLLSGDHARVARWRADQSQQDTQIRRPDLWTAHQEQQRPNRGAPRSKKS